MRSIRIKKGVLTRAWAAILMRPGCVMYDVVVAADAGPPRNGKERSSAVLQSSTTRCLVVCLTVIFITATPIPRPHLGHDIFDSPSVALEPTLQPGAPLSRRVFANTLRVRLSANSPCRTHHQYKTGTGREDRRRSDNIKSKESARSSKLLAPGKLQEEKISRKSAISS